MSGSVSNNTRFRRTNAAVFEGRVAQFTKELEISADRTRKLLARPTPNNSVSSSSSSSNASVVEHHDPELTRAALDELRVQHEELIVAEEELRAQLHELKSLGARLRTDRERYAQLFHRAPEAYVVTDRNGAIREANAAAAVMFGLHDPHALRSKPLVSWLSPHDLPIIHALLQNLAPRAPTTFVDLSIRRGKGEPDMRTAARISSADVDHILWILRPPDADDSVPDAETSLSSTSGPVATPNEALLARSLRDKEDLLQRERRARVDLERANRAKDKFIAILSHDLRSPLNAILGWTQILRREILDHTARNRAFETIERNAKAQAKLIEELLDISRVAADRVQLALTAIDIGVLVQRIHHGALPDAAKREIKLTCDVLAPHLTIVGDRQRLEQVLGNLISNALKHTAAGGEINLRVERSQGLHESSRVDIIVADNGHGIDPALLPRIFDMYMQDQSLAAARSGLGIGLYIVKQLVELHEGTVTATSEGQDKGATFRVSLPLHRALDPRSDGGGGVAPPSPRSELDLGGAISDVLRYVRVLVVDDEEDSCDLMAMILRRAGAHVACATDLGDATRVFDAYEPDVVVSDLAMPGGDGYELIALLRKKNPQIIGLAVSGFTSDREVERALSAGFDVHVGKPIEANQLVEAIEEAIRMRADG